MARKQHRPTPTMQHCLEPANRHCWLCGKTMWVAYHTTRIIKDSRYLAMACASDLQQGY
ncbi:MAG: hypothetical protein H0V70_26725 [Ktedonobacteraceae bacterium]|nr:hypothetical protein [Ktedonobacteraceae bacterium]